MYEIAYETRLCMRLCCAFILFHVTDYIYHLYVLAYDGLRWNIILCCQNIQDYIFCCQNIRDYFVPCIRLYIIFIVPIIFHVSDYI
jgi:hypothetical protein